MIPRDEVDEYLRNLYERSLEGAPVSPVASFPTDVTPQPSRKPLFPSMLSAEFPALDNVRKQNELELDAERQATEGLVEAAGQSVGRGLGGPRPDAARLTAMGDGGGVPTGYLDALRRAQSRDDMSAAFSRLGQAGEQFAEVASRGAYKASPLAPMPSEVSKEEKRRQAVLDYLKQQRDAESSLVDAEYKRGLLKRMAEPKPLAPPRSGLTQEQINEKFTKDLENTQATIDAKRRQGLPKPPKPPRPSTGLTREERITTDLRREFESQPAVKAFGDVQSAFGKVSEAAKGNSPASDLSMLYSYAKLLDPGSVVRESEFQTMAQTGAFGDKVAAAVKRLAVGERLTESQRADFVRAAKQQFDVYGKQFDEAAARYEALAKKSGVTPEDVVFRRKAFVEGQQAAPQGAPAAGKVRVRRKSDGKVVEVEASLADKLVTANQAEMVP